MQKRLELEEISQWHKKTNASFSLALGKEGFVLVSLHNNVFELI